MFANYWTAYDDEKHQTWHDKWLNTYVVEDSRDLASRNASSSEGVMMGFWVFLIFIALIILGVIAYSPFIIALVASSHNGN